MSDNNFRTDLDEFIDLWQQSEEEGVHPTPEAPAPLDTQGSDSAQDLYYDFLEKEIDLIQESETPNPVYPDSAGPDHLTTPAVWADEKTIEEVENLKNKLFELENRLASKMGGGEKWVEKSHEPNDKKMMDEIESLKGEIGKLSSTLGVEHEPTPWKTEEK